MKRNGKFAHFDGIICALYRNLPFKYRFPLQPYADKAASLNVREQKDGFRFEGRVAAFDLRSDGNRFADYTYRQESAHVKP